MYEITCCGIVFLYAVNVLLSLAYFKKKKAAFAYGKAW